MDERSEVGKLLTVRAAAAWVWLVGYPASIALTIYGFVMAWSGRFAIGVPSVALGVTLAGLLTILFVAIRNRSEKRLWEVVKRHPGTIAGNGAGVSVVGGLADGLASKPAEVEARRSRYLSKRLAVLRLRPQPAPTILMDALLVFFLAAGFLMRAFGVRAVVLVATVAVGLFVARGTLLVRKPIKLLELGSLVLLGGLALICLLIQPISERASQLWLQGGIVAVIVGSILLGRPFTLEYARDRAPPGVAIIPLVKNIHMARSAAWALIFAGLVIPTGLHYIRGTTRDEALTVLLACAAGAIYLFMWRPRAFDRRGPAAYLATVLAWLGLARFFGKSTRQPP